MALAFGRWLRANALYWAAVCCYAVERLLNFTFNLRIRLGPSENGVHLAPFNRVIVGNGCSGVANLATLPAKASKGVVVVSDGPDPWSTRGRLQMGQPPGEFESTAWRHQPRLLVADPSKFTAAHEFAAALRLTKFYQPSRCISGRLLSFKRATASSADLELTIRDGEHIRTFLCRAADLTVGPGPRRELPPHYLHVDPDEGAGLLDLLQRDGRVVYGDEHLAGRWRPGKIAVWGGGATAAWNAELATSRGCEVVWVARPSTRPPTNPLVRPEFDELVSRQSVLKVAERERQEELRAFGDAMLPRNLQEGAAFDDPGVSQRIAAVTGIRPNGKRVCLDFAAGPPEEFDQIVVSHGQDPERSGGILNLLSTNPMSLITDDTDEELLVAILSDDLPVRVLGAAVWVDGIGSLTSDLPLYQAHRNLSLASLPPHSKGVAVSIHLAAKTIPRANLLLETLD